MSDFCKPCAERGRPSWQTRFTRQPRRWTSIEIRRLRALYPSQGQKRCAEILFRPLRAVMSKAKRLGLRVDRTYHVWKVGEIEKLRAIFPHISTAQAAKQLSLPCQTVSAKAKKLSLRKTEVYLASPAACRLRRGSNSGVPFRYKPGHVPANKGLRCPGYAPGRMAQTQFRKGQRPANYLPVGTMLPNGDGYLRIKISEKSDGKGAKDKAWEFVHRRVWEAAHGRIPRGHRLWWKDKDHTNNALENLELLTDAEHMARTTIHNLPPELKHAILLKGALLRRIRTIEKENSDAEEYADGPAQPSV